MANIKLFKKLKLSIPLALLIGLYALIIAFLIILRINNNKNYNVLLNSIDTLSKDNTIVPLLYQTSSELSLAENKFRIYLNTGDTAYREKFLQHINVSVSNLETIEHSKDSLEISNIISKCGQGVQLADAIIRLRKISDSLSNKFYNIHSVYNNPIELKEINKDILKKYINTTNQTDTLKVTAEKKSFFKRLFSKKNKNKYELVKGSNISNKKADSTDSVKTSDEYKLSKQVQQYYQKSLNKQWASRQKLNNAEKRLAENNLLIIDGINSAIKVALQNKFIQKQKADNEVILRIAKTKDSIKTFSWILLIAILCVIIALLLIITKEARFQEQKTLHAIAEKLMMERKLLQSQMDPHFVFNALASIQGYILKNDTEKAITYLSKFSKLMRQILMHSKENKILLDDEIATLENYIIVQQLNLQNQFEYVIEDNNLLNNQIYIPPMLIQPFVENAVEHGLRHLTERKGKLIISFEEDKANNCIVCKVDDNGIGMEQSNIEEKDIPKHKSMAISIAEDRIDKMLADNRFSTKKIEIIDKSKLNYGSFGVLVIINIPII